MDAVIDIGSNSVRLYIDKGKAVNPKILNTTRLSQNLAVFGRLDSQAIVRTANAVTDFFCSAKNTGADRIFIFGTEAMRCPGGETLKAMIESKIHVPVDIISGEKEAVCGYIGATGGKGKNAVIDIGGASVELTAGDGANITYAESLKLGVVRAYDTAGKNRAAIEKYYSENIGGFQKIAADKLIGIGGTATSLASMALEQQKYDAHAIHGYTLTKSKTEELIDVIFTSDSITDSFPSIDRKRADVIGHGAIALLMLMEHLSFDKIDISEHDNIEGYLTLQNLTARR